MIAAEVLTREAVDADSAASLNVRLLADIRDVFQPEVTFVKSAALCELLRPWTTHPGVTSTLAPVESLEDVQ